MRLRFRVPTLAALAAAAISLTARGQEPPAATPTPAAPPAVPAAAPAPEPTASAADVALPLPTPIAPTALRIRDLPSITVEKLPAENPFGKAVEIPAALPQKLAFVDAETPASFFLSVHVDAAGRPLSVRRDRDPIPSLAAETLKSVSRWTFAPARKGGQPVDSWGAYRMDLQVEIRSPKITQMTLTPIAPSAPIPKPFDWKPEVDWLESRHVAPPDDGSVPIEQVDIAPLPQKTPWSGDSYRGPFTARFWVLVDKTGRITKAIPIEISDPVLLAYLRKAMGAWLLRPAQSGGAPVDSWNELVLGGTISYSDEIKQIIALRKNIGP
ncbi:MAG TPA: hypothetical protein VKG23_13170 [Thermoanaerobaculia bacterium]|nr:hypothetical protein [Thermoanaerobaculia bacterium]